MRLLPFASALRVVLRLAGRLSALLLALCLLPAAPADARDGSRRTDAFEDETFVVVVEVPVNVVRDGRPVRGLTAADFEVYDGRKRRELVGFEVIDLEALEAPSGSGAEVPIAARRHFLLLFDLEGLDGTGIQRAVDGGRQLLASGLHPTDLVGVGYYGQRRGAGLLLGFTSDRDEVSLVLDRFQALLDGSPEDAPSDVARQADPLRLVGGGSLSDLNQEDLANAFLGDMSGRGAMNADTLMDMSRISTGYTQEARRSRFAAKAEGLSRLADATASLEGRKFLVLFSEDVPTELFYETEDDVRSLLDQKSGARSLRDLTEMANRFKRAGWTIQAVDAAGTRGGQGLTAGGAFLSLAEETGGETFTNFNDLGEAVDRMLGKSSVTYLLAFQIEDVRTDGKFHPVRVELADAPRGTKLFHRTGYTAPTEDQGGIAETLSTAEMILSGETSGDLDASVLMASFQGPAADAESGAGAQTPVGEQTHVTVWVEVPGDALFGDAGARTAAAESTEVEIFAYALDDQYEIHDFFTQTVRLDREKLGERLRGSTFKVYGDFDLAPGDYDLRLLVRESATGRHALRSHPFTAEALGDGEPHILPPFLLDLDADSVVVRERTPEGAGDRYPFVLGEEGAEEVFVPSVAPSVGGGAHRVCLMGYHLLRDELLLDAGVQSADGRALGPERLTVVGRSETKSNGLDRLYLNLDTEGLPAGEYQLRVAIHDLRAQRTEQSFLPLTVSP